MIVELLHGMKRIDGAIARRFGPIYNGVLGMGLIIEIARRLREFDELPRFDAGAVRAILAIALFLFLLLHQLSELAEHIDRRTERAKARRQKDGR